MEICLAIGVIGALILILIAAFACVIGLHMALTYDYVTKRRKMSFHDFWRLYRRHRLC